jgi:hypothetical protein
MDQQKHQKLIKDSIVGGVANLVINGGIQFFMLRGETPLPLSVDSITNEEHTVLGAAVPLAISLAVILTVITYFTLKEAKPPFFPKVFWMVLQHGFFTFGVITALAVLWQRYVGTVEVGLWPAVLITGLIAGVVSAVINYLTIERCLLPEPTPGLAT